MQNNALLQADIFENFQNKCIQIYVLDTAYFLSTLRLAWKVCLKKTERIKFALSFNYH